MRPSFHPEPAAAARIELRYRGTTEQRIMAAVSALAWLASLLPVPDQHPLR